MFIPLFYDSSYQRGNQWLDLLKSNDKVSDHEAHTAWNRVIPCIFFQNTDPVVFVLFNSIYFYLLYQRGYQRQYFWTLYLKLLAYEAATAWNRGIPCNIWNFLIKLYLVLLNGSKMLSEVRSFEIKWICRPIRQIHPKTGESLVSFSKY